MKKILGICILIVAIMGFWLLSILTFNPFTNYQEIQMMRKMTFLAIDYAKKNGRDLNQLAKLDEVLPLNQSEKLFLESHGFRVMKTPQNDVIATLSKGFDDLIIYNYSKNCWSATQKVLFLDKCQTP